MSRNYTPHCKNYAEYLKKPFEFGIIRNHYTGRTFIQSSKSIRNLSVKLKHNPNLSFLKDKNIALIDDSIVRGTTSIKIVEMLKNAGVKKIHMRIASPPVKYPCFYGIDTPTKEELLASKFSIDEIKIDFNTITNHEYLIPKNKINKIGILFKKIQKND